MSQHKALEMFGRSGNPSLNDATFTSESYGQGRVMTLQNRNPAGFARFSRRLPMEFVFSER